MKEAPKTAVAYCRTSTATQKEADTIQAQFSRCRALLERHGVKLLKYGPREDGWLVDDGVSGSLLQGRTFATFVEDLRTRRVRPDFLVVYSLSRISRIDKSSRSMEKLVASAQDAATIKAVLLGAQVKVIDEDGINDPATVMYDLKTTLAAEEYKLIQSRTTAGKAERLAKGSTCIGSRPPFGYKLERIDPTDKKKGLRWVPHPEQAPQLRQVLKWYVEAGATFAARKATAAKFRVAFADHKRKHRAEGWTPTFWQAGTVEAMRKKARLYLGSYTMNLGSESYAITYEPLIDSKLFARVERRSREFTVKHRATFLSTGFVDCTCGHHMHNRQNGAMNYARCDWGCGSIPEKAFSAGLWDAVVSRLVQIKEKETGAERENGLASEIETARAQVTAVQAKLLRLAEMREDGLDRATWRTRNEALSQTLALAQSEVDRLVQEREAKEKKHANEQTLADRVDALLAELLKKEPTLEKKRHLLADVLQGERVTVSWEARRSSHRASLGATIVLPAFGTLPPMKRKIDPAKAWVRQHDFW